MTRFALVAGLLALGSAAAAQPPPAAPAPPPQELLPRPATTPVANVAVTPDIVYGTVGAEKLMLDLAVPRTGGPHPLVLCLHGGAWKAGSRKDLSKGVMWADFGTGRTSLIESLAGEGFAAASVSYRFAPTAKFPAQIQDVKTALRFLRANAKRLNLDPDRVGVLGFSAGGHLAALVGLTDGVEAFAGTEHPGYSTKVNCVVDFFGPADLTLYSETPGIEKAFMAPLLGGRSSDHPELYTQASPVTYAAKDAPPFLIVHGTADVVVPLLHSKRLHERLTAAGAASELVRVPGKGHGWFGPEAAASYAATTKFLTEYLKK